MSIKQRAKEILAEYRSNDELKILVTLVVFNVPLRGQFQSIYNAVDAICGDRTDHARYRTQCTESSGVMYTSQYPNVVITADPLSVAKILDDYSLIFNEQKTIESVLRWNKLFGKPENIKRFHDIIAKL